MRRLIIIALLLFSVSIAWAGKAILLVDKDTGDYYESTAEADIETVWGGVNIILETEIDAFSELQALVADKTIVDTTQIDTFAELQALVADKTIVDLTQINTESLFEAICAALNFYTSADSEPVNWQTAYGWGDHSSQNYMDWDTDTASPSDADTTHVSTADQIYDFVIGLGYITATLTEEEVEDYVGGMLGGTETLISVDYQDATGDIDFVVNDDLSQYDNTTSAFLTGNETITLSGHVTGSGATAITTTIVADVITNAMIRADEVYDSDLNLGVDANQINTADIPELTNLYYTEARVSANASVSANTAKVTESTTATSPLVKTTYDISIPAATNAAAGHATAAHITALEANTAKVTESTTVTSPLVLSTYDISIPVATTSADGYLSQTDWDTFNNKQTAGNYITALTGNVTASGPGSVVATIAANAILNTMIAADEVYDSDINWGAGVNQVNMDDIGDGSTNAAITLTQETAYDAVVTADPSDYDEYSDLPVAVITDNDTTHIPNCENVFEFCETTQAYLQSADISAYMQDEDINTFSELDSWVSDKELVNADDGEVWSGTHDFTNQLKLQTDKFIVCDTYTDEGINACIDALGSEGGTVYLPEGTYTIDGVITIDYDYTILQGSGWGTYLNASAWSDNDVINLNGKDYCQIRNLRIEGQDGGGNANSLIWSGSGADYAIIVNCNFTFADREGIYIEDSDYCIIKNNAFWYCDNNSINVDNCKNIIVEDNSSDLGFIGIWVINSEYAIISKNHLSNLSEADIYIEISSYISLTDNICKSAAGYSDWGIYMENSDYCNITGNLCSTHDTSGITIDANSDNNHVANNQLEGEAVAKIVDSGSNNTVVNAVAGVTTLSGTLQVDGNEIGLGDAGGFSGFKFDAINTILNVYIDGNSIGHFATDGSYTDDVP